MSLQTFIVKCTVNLYYTSLINVHVLGIRLGCAPQLGLTNRLCQQEEETTMFLCLCLLGTTSIYTQASTHCKKVLKYSFTFALVVVFVPHDPHALRRLVLFKRLFEDVVVGLVAQVPDKDAEVVLWPVHQRRVQPEVFW